LSKVAEDIKRRKRDTISTEMEERNIVCSWRKKISKSLWNILGTGPKMASDKDTCRKGWSD